MHLNIFVSSKCFLYCKGCYSSSREESRHKIVSTEKIIIFLKYMYKKGLRKVTICGGDPLTRYDIIELLQEIKKIGYYISLDTVGTSILKPIIQNEKVILKQIDAKKIADLVDMIGIPIDGSTNEIVKLFRQTNTDILEEQLSICEILNKYNANICINTVAHKGNISDSINMTKIINDLDYIKKWQIFQYTPIGKFGKLNKDDFEITDQEFLNFKINILNEYKHDKTKIEFKSSLNREKKYMLIDNSGNAWISSLKAKKFIGNILNENDWDEISKYFNERGEL